jgi:hypothetical protein
MNELAGQARDQLHVSALSGGREVRDDSTHLGLELQSSARSTDYGALALNLRSTRSSLRNKSCTLIMPT